MTPAKYLCVVVTSLWFSGNELEGLYVGLWPVTILAFAIVIRQRRNDDKNKML